MRTETITESKKARLPLDPEVAEALRIAGRQLASKASWWGAEREDEVVEGEDGPDGEEAYEKTTVIECVRDIEGTYTVVVRNAVGLIAVGDLQLLVKPKIPDPHFLHLLEASEFFPRTTTSKAHAAGGESFWDLVAGWYADCVERLMRRGIVLDYVGRADALPFVRGHINGLRTAQAYYQGRLDIECEYEDFGQDTPLNRVLKAAGDVVTRSPSLSPALRQRMKAILTRFDDVGAFRPNDLRHVPDRRTAHYRDSARLARLILGSVHRVLSHGDQLVWTFLIPTPVMIEEGVRRELVRLLEGDVLVLKRSFPLDGSTMRMNPDLVFGDIAAVGDVKYKLFTGGRWPRADLNQIVAFAAAARTRRGLIVGFRPADGPPLPRIGVGDIQISYVGWEVGESVTPSVAAAQLAENLRMQLLKGVVTPIAA